LHSTKKHIPKKFGLWNVFVGVTIILGMILILNILLTFNLNSELKKSAEEFNERLRPANIELILIKNSKCSDCFDLSQIISHIKNANVNITKQKTLEFDSKEVKQIISTYKIQKVPTIILTGEIDKVNIQGLEKKENALLFTKPEPPYTNAETGRIEGRVMLYQLMDLDCIKCGNLSFLISQIKAAGIKIYEEKDIEADSHEGKELMKKYNIDFAPTIILSKDADAYSIMQQAWPRVGSKESDGSYVLRTAYPPYINLTTDKLRGLVNIIYLTDKSCIDCYNVNRHREILASPQGFAMKLEKEEAIDINDAKGKEIVAKYNITNVPTIILYNDVEAYPSSQGLKQFFSLEEDGSYVFRKVQIVGTYKDLTTNQVVEPQQEVIK